MLKPSAATIIEAKKNNKGIVSTIFFFFYILKTHISTVFFFMFGFIINVVERDARVRVRPILLCVRRSCITCVTEVEESLRLKSRKIKTTFSIEGNIIIIYTRSSANIIIIIIKYVLYRWNMHVFLTKRRDGDQVLRVLRYDDTEWRVFIWGREVVRIKILTLITNKKYQFLICVDQYLN